ncbi:AMP-binding protein [Chitinophaga japonensis]|uniref:Acyl-CoA synthetase (AMP-forming)/AMP-acid ligase II n=1 Tax=Chitinophaga japonensis TaxID=104662 RepID=A0A562T099_CHIJA|nr:AMP-binding protein [Chitinophaga japonensis]TWI86728.1 acyl-CoA synthetase (AMP-forming)/AMP-acid ligase II [Chitinophaga japonensis]
MQLYERIAANPRLVYTDASTGQSFRAADRRGSLGLEDARGLALLYIDNTLTAVEVLLNFLDSRFTIALLSPALHVEYKQQLEAIYRPSYIYDPSRPAVAGYAAVQANERVRLFKDTNAAAYTIHPDTRLLLSTSGTTGSPKFVKLSEENLVQNALSILAYLPVSGTDVTPLNLPLYYSYGLSVFTTNSMAGGQVVCTSRDVLQPAFWEDLQRYGFTSLAGVPYVYEMFYRIGFCKKEYPSLRYLTQAGGKLNAVLAKAFGEYAAAHGKDFFIMYGQTEATARMAYLPPADLLRKTGSIGIPIPNGRFDIDPATQELLYTGPNVGGGYAACAADLAFFDGGQVLRTGDMARQDEDGYYYITGRLKRFVKLFGTRVNLDEVEQILKQAFGGQTFACTGVEDKHLLVLLREDTPDSAAVKQLLSEKLGLHPRAFMVKQVDDFIFTPNGKMDYQDMMKM